MINMINKFLNMIENAFMWSLVITGIIMAIVAIVKGKEHYDYKQRERRERAERQLGIMKIKSESKKWDDQRKISYLNDWIKEYERINARNNKISDNGPPYPYVMGTILTVWINGEMNFFSVNIDELHDLCVYLKESLNDIR